MRVRLRPGPEMEALAATVRAIASSDVLPGPFDAPTQIPPVHRAWFRRVPGCNVWLLFTT